MQMLVFSPKLLCNGTQLHSATSTSHSDSQSSVIRCGVPENCVGTVYDVSVTEDVVVVGV